MNIQQSMAIANLGASRKAVDYAQREPTASGKQVAERVFALAEEQGRHLLGTPASWQRDWLKSEKFYLLDIPLHFAACPRYPTDDSKVQGCMAASADSAEPIIVDLNIHKVGIAQAGYHPPVIVVDGVYRHAAGKLAGRETIRAWVGELAAQALKLTIHADHQFGSNELRDKLGKCLSAQYQSTSDNGPVAESGSVYKPHPYIEEVYPLENYFVYSYDSKKYRQHYKTNLKSRTVKLVDGPKEVTQKYVDMAASAEDVAKKFRRFQVTSIEAAMQVFAAGAGGMGGPGSSLGSGSGPSMAMKPAPTPGGGMKMPLGKPAMGSPVKMRAARRKKMRERKLKSSGYMGYKDASNEQRQKTKGGSKSEMSKQLKGSGYYGYKDASDEERQRKKAPKGSEMEDSETRNKNYSSIHDVGGLKGAAAKVAKIVTKYKAARHAGYKPRMEAVAPPGMEHVVKGLKKHFGEGSSSPFKIAWWMHDKKSKKGK